MRKCKILSYVLFILLMMTSIVSAEEKIVEECTYPTGKIIGFPTYRVSYEISDTHVAEVFKASNGELRVRFINPGDVYVRVIFYSGGKPAQTQLYLFHITGKSIGSNAVDRSTFARDVLNLVNKERAKHGLKPLRLENDLNQYAQIRAKECIKKFSHTRPNGTGFETVIKVKNYATVGENLQAGATSPEQVVYEWMHSPGHRANILSSDYEELGVGYVYDENSKYRHYWTQLFRRKR